MKITACSIVKNEEKNIARSIESYKKAADEIIIVDTGSTDNTVEICKKLGAKVLHYEWHNDFAAAKNFALDQATGDWIFFLDADEWFVPSLEDKRIHHILKSLEKQHGSKAVRVNLCNIDEPTNVIRSKTEVLRIFKNDEHIRYVGKVHEKVLYDDKSMPSAKLKELEIYHSGYSDTVLPQKTQRNLEVLYTQYKQGKAQTDTYFYLARENYVAHNWDEFVKFHALFDKQPDRDEFISGTNVFVSIYEFAINYKFMNRDKYTLEEIKQEIDQAIEAYPQLPIHYYYRGIYHTQFDYKKATEDIEYALKQHEGYEGFYINTFGGLVVKAYNELARLYKLIHAYDKAFDYALLTLQKDLLNKDAFKEMLHFIREQETADIIAFLNQLYDINNKGHVEFLARQLMNSRCHQVFLYYAMRYNKEFDGQNETTYMAMILSQRTELAVETALTAYINARSEEDRFFAALVILKHKRLDLFEETRMQMNPFYCQIVNRYLQADKIMNLSSQEIHAFKHLYGHMYYIATRQELEEMEELFEQLPDEIAGNIIQCLLHDKNYSELMFKINKFQQMPHLHNLFCQLDKVYAFASYLTKNYGQGLTYFEKVLQSSDCDMDNKILLYLKVMSEFQDNEVISIKAQKLHNKYEPIFTDYILISDMLSTGKVKQIATEYDSMKIEEITCIQLQKIAESTQEPVSDTMLKSLFQLMETYIEKEMDEAAHYILLKLLASGYKIDIVYYRLGEIYNKFQNPQASLYCHMKVFEENAVFAETLIRDAAMPQYHYIYKKINELSSDCCPICGDTGNLKWVFNTLTSSDFTEEFSPIKEWMYCPECHHQFVRQRPENFEFNADKDLILTKIKQVSDQVFAYNDTMKFIMPYVRKGRLLDVGSGAGAFIASALEYGLDAIGLEPIKDLAKASSQLLEVEVVPCTLEDYKSQEKYDTIAMTCTLENLQQPEQAVKKVYGLLSNEGMLYIETPNFDSGYSRVLKDKCPTLRLTQMLHYYSKTSLEKLLTHHGFEVLDYQISKRNKGYMEVIAQKK